MLPKAIFIIGPTGCGKTTLGNRLASKLNCVFIDADNYHSSNNIKKMSSGQPLMDEDRYPWLQAVKNAVLDNLKMNPNHVVLACSALKRVYRNFLSLVDNNSVEEYYFYLQADYDLLRRRLLCRENHFMPESLIQSQLDTFELPSFHQPNFFVLEANLDIEELIFQIESIVQ